MGSLAYSTSKGNIAGLDSANLLYKEGYRIAMCGTIALYDDEGNRMHTVYFAAAPEYGKETFIKRFSSDIEKMKSRFPDATYVGVADGAPDNWTFLEGYVAVVCWLRFQHKYRFTDSYSA